MYPRNAASPEPIAIGAVVQISDGAVQTSGVTVRIKPVGVAEGNGAGTVAYSTDGVVLYTPTQGETNYTSFILIASKSGCLPASQTIITSESSTSGRVYVATNSDKTNYSLSAAGVTGVTDGVWNALLATYTTAGTFGARIMRTDSASAGNGAKVTGAGHVAADIHELQAGVITAGDFAANAIDANALAADAVAEIQSGLATAANQTILIDGMGYITSVLMGSIADAGTAAETYQIQFGGATYTVDYSGLDATGNRSATTRTKT